MKNNGDSFKGQVVIVLVIAGLIILWDSFSWSSGGMNGLISMLIVFLALLVLGSMFLGRVAGNFLQSKETKNDNSQSEEKKMHL